MVVGSAGLEDGFVFEGPQGGGIELPCLQRRDQGGNLVEILTMISPKIETTSLPHPASNEFKKVCPQQAVFMVTFFRPRIRKQNPNLGKPDARGQRIDQFARLGPDKVAIIEPGALGFSFRALNALTDNIHAKAEVVRKF